MDTINKALKITMEAHNGQTDKGGHSYIFHPIRVALNCNSKAEKVAALLHDVVEDTPITLEDLKAEGFDDSIIEAVKCLTKTRGEDYQDFIKRVAKNPIAREVKIQDLQDNMDVSRLVGKPHWKLDVYQKALHYLYASIRFSDVLSGALIPATKEEKAKYERILAEHYKMLTDAHKKSIPT